jgi:hypothetical protein
MEINAYASSLNFRRHDYIIMVVSILISIYFLVLLLKPIENTFRRDLRRIAYVSDLSKDVRRKFSGTLNWWPIEYGSAIYPGDYVFTGNSSEAIINLNDSESTLIIQSQSLIRIEDSENQFSFTVKEGLMAIKIDADIKIKVKSGAKIYELWSSKDALLTIMASQDGELNIKKASTKVMIKVDDKIYEILENEEVNIAANAVLTRRKILPQAPVRDTTFDALEKFLTDKVDHTVWKLEKLKIKK